MMLVTLVYASLMLISVGGSALASSGHRITELLHVRDDVAQWTLPAEQHLPLLQSTSAEARKSLTGLTSPPGGSQSLHAAPVVPAAHLAFAAWVKFVAIQPVFVAARPTEWPNQGAILALLQRHHRTVVLHL